MNSSISMDEYADDLFCEQSDFVIYGSALESPMTDDCRKTDEIVSMKTITGVASVLAHSLLLILAYFSITTPGNIRGFVDGKAMDIISISLIGKNGQASGAGQLKKNQHQIEVSSGIQTAKAASDTLTTEPQKELRLNHQEVQTVKKSIQPPTQNSKIKKIEKTVTKDKVASQSQKPSNFININSITQETTVKTQETPSIERDSNAIASSSHGDTRPSDDVLAQEGNPGVAQNSADFSDGQGVDAGVVGIATGSGVEKGSGAAPGIGTSTGPGIGLATGVGTGNGGLSRLGLGAANGPKVLRRVVPKYPTDARRMNKEGLVVLQLVLDKDGKIEDISVLQTPGYGLEAEAIKAARSSKFSPAKQGGEDVGCITIYPFQFSLRG